MAFLGRSSGRLGGLMLAGILALGLAAAGLAQDARFFRIGTAATTGTYFPVGGVIANAVSNPPGSRECDRGGSCGVPGLIAVAQATQGSVENVVAIAAGRLESGFSQADVASWAYNGTGVFKQPLRNLRAIASLFPESLHIVVRADSDITKLEDLKGKRVSLGEPESGTLVDARLILETVGLNERAIRPEYLKSGQAAEGLRQGTLDAFFLFAGYPVPIIADLASMTPIRLLPVPDAVLAKLEQRVAFFARNTIPSAAYAGIDEDVRTLGVNAIWVVAESLDAKLVYALTKALWHENTRRLLEAGHPMGRRIRQDKALEGIAIPLHPGAEQFYREVGLPLDTPKP